MNNIAVTPYICMHALQIQNVKRNIVKKASIKELNNETNEELNNQNEIEININEKNINEININGTNKNELPEILSNDLNI